MNEMAGQSNTPEDAAGTEHMPATREPTEMTATQEMPATHEADKTPATARQGAQESGAATAADNGHSDAAAHGEQRRHERRGFKVNRLIRAALAFDGGEPKEQYLYLVDISEGGLRVNVDNSFEMEKPFRISFTLQYLDLEVMVRPIWQKGLAGGTWTCGLAFHDPTPEQLAQVTAMVESFSVQGRRERFRLKALVSVALRQDEGDWFNILLVDISPNGLRGMWDDPLEEGVPVDVRILPPGLREVEAIAEVVWQQQIGPRRHEFGIKFTDISEACAATVQTFIDRSVGAA